MKKNSKTENNVNKSRYGRVSHKKKYDEEVQTVLKDTYDSIDESLRIPTKANDSLVTNNYTHDSKSKENGFNIGDLVWAKTGKYPVWPGIVVSDPDSKNISKNENNCAMLHIYYFNDAFRRNWIKINQIFKFSSKKKVLTELPKNYTQITRTALKAKWNRAVDEAECLAPMSREGRISAFFVNNYLPLVHVPLIDTSEVHNSKIKQQKDNVSALQNPAKNNQKIETTSNTKAQSEIDTLKRNKQKVEAHTSTNSNTVAEDNSPKKNKQNVEISSNTKAQPEGNNLDKNKQKVEVSSSTNAQPEKRKLLHTNIISNGTLEKKRKLNDEKANVSDNHHKISNQNDSQQISVNAIPKDHPKILIPELCKLFYTNGWVTGTGGGISIKYNDQIFIAPSGVQKERMEAEDLFVQDMNGLDIKTPSADKNLSKSQCTPIFMCSYIERNAGAVIHVHSQEAIKLCLLNPKNELRINDLEIIKGMFNEAENRFYENDEEVVIPIINNSKYERDLVDKFKWALTKYPKTSAVLVRNHGMYVWGKDWKSAKTQCECYEYAFNILIFKKLNKL